MAAQLTVEPCATCNGGRLALERFEEIPLGGCCDADDWIPSVVFGDDFRARFPREVLLDFADRLAAEYPLLYRWIDAPCPRCGGEGSYVVEHTVCRIF